MLLNPLPTDWESRAPRARASLWASRLDRPHDHIESVATFFRDFLLAASGKEPAPTRQAKPHHERAQAITSGF